jgi:hypothetical protein
MTGIRPGAAAPAATVTPGTGTGTGATEHAWHRLATAPRARQLSATQRLAYLAVAHHRDHTHSTTGEDQTSTAADVVRWTRLPFTAVVPALTMLAAIGWLDGDDTSGYAIAATSGPPPQTHQPGPTA